MLRLAIAVLIVSACSSDHSQGPRDAAPDGAPDAIGPSSITFTATPKRLVANGIVKARLTITLRDGNGAPLAGRPVTLTSDVPATIEPTSGTTDAMGVMTATLRSTDIGARQLTAIADDLTATATVTLTDPCAAPRLPGNPGVGLVHSVAGDFNGDGVLDLAGMTPTGFGFASGNADGSFQPIEVVSNITSGVAIVAGDFNGDGQLD